MLFFFIIFIAIVVFESAAELIYKRTRRYRESDEYRLSHCVPTELDIVNIGSTPGRYDIVYDDSPWKGYNLSTVPQSFKYSFRLLRRWKNHLSNGCIIIIITCPLSFAKNKGYTLRDYSDRFYAVLPKEEIDNYSYIRAVLLRRPLLMKVFRKGKKILHLIFSNEKSSQAVTDVGTGEPHIISTWKQACYLNDLKDPMQAEKHLPVFAEKVEIVRNGIDFCREQGWRPIIVIPPIPVETKRYISDSFRKRFIYDNLEAVMEGNTDIPILDYWNDERVDEKWFRDDFVMNERGRTRFSRMLFLDVRNTMEGEKR